MGQTRRLITIKEKLEVLEFRNQRLQELKKAKKASCEPVNKSWSPEDKEAARKAKSKAKAEIRRGVEKACKEQFPHIIGNSKVSKWEKTATLEPWRDLPEPFTARRSTATNEWRRRVGAPLKGRSEGGGVPLELQKELDHLVAEMALGNSEVSERREAVTAEQVVPLMQHDLR